MARRVIIGLGNADRGDDALGLVASRRLRAWLTEPARSSLARKCRAPLGARLTADVEVREGCADAAAFVEALRGADVVMVIDAIVSGAAPGTVHRFDPLTQALPSSARRASSHAFDVAEAIELARVIYGLPRRLLIYGVEAAHATPGAALSPAVEGACAVLMARVLEEVGDLCHA